MDNISQHIEFVKGQQAFHERQALRFAGDLRRMEQHTATAEKFKSLANDLAILEEKLAGGGAISGPVLPGGFYRLALTRDEIEGLPEELMRELNVSDADKAEFSIVAVIDDTGGVATLDRILVALYHQSGQIMKRANLNARLYRMSQKGFIHNVPGKKGVYSTSPLTDEDITKLI